MQENWDNDENFEDIFKKHLADFESEVPKDAWDFINQHISVKKSFWQNPRNYLLPITLLFLGGIYLVSDSNFKITLNEKTLLNLSLNKTTNKSQTIDNQIITKNNSLNPEILNKEEQRDAEIANKKPQSIDNQRIVKNNSTHPEILNKEKQKDIKTINTSQNTDNQEIVKNNSTHPEILNKEKQKDIKIINTSQNADNQIITKETNIASLEKNILETKNNLPNPSISSQHIVIKQRKIKKPLYIGFQISPIYTFRQINPNQNDNIVITQLKPESGFSYQNTGILLGLNIEKQMLQRWNIFAQIDFMEMKLTDNYSFYYEDSITYSTTVIDANEIRTSPQYTTYHKELQAKYQSLTTQLGLKFYLGGQHLQQSLRLGIGYNLLINKQIYTEGFTPNNNRLGNLFMTLGYECRFRLSDRWGLNIEPFGQYFLQKFYQNENLYQIHPYNLGLKIGLNYRVY